MVELQLRRFHAGELDYDQQAKVKPMLTRALRYDHSRYLRLQQTVKRRANNGKQ